MLLPDKTTIQFSIHRLCTHCCHVGLSYFRPCADCLPIFPHVFLSSRFQFNRRPLLLQGDHVAQLALKGTADLLCCAFNDFRHPVVTAFMIDCKCILHLIYRLSAVSLAADFDLCLPFGHFFFVSFEGKLSFWVLKTGEKEAVKAQGRGWGLCWVGPEPEAQCRRRLTTWIVEEWEGRRMRGMKRRSGVCESLQLSCHSAEFGSKI